MDKIIIIIWAILLPVTIIPVAILFITSFITYFIFKSKKISNNLSNLAFWTFCWGQLRK